MSCDPALCIFLLSQDTIKFFQCLIHRLLYECLESFDYSSFIVHRQRYSQYQQSSNSPEKAPNPDFKIHLIKEVPHLLVLIIINRIGPQDFGYNRELGQRGGMARGYLVHEPVKHGATCFRRLV